MPQSVIFSQRGLRYRRVLAAPDTIMLLSPDDPILPASYVQQLAGLVASWGISPAQLLAGTGLNEELLLRPLAHITARQYAAVISRARELTTEPALALWWGQQMRLSWHGPVGFAVLASSSLREALDVGARFLPLRSPEMTMSWRVQGDAAEITFRHQFASAVIAEFSLIGLCLFFARVAEELLGTIPGMRAELAMPQPEWFASHRDMLTAPIIFSPSATAHRAWIAVDLLDKPLASGDPAARQRAVAECEQEMRELLARRGYAGQVRRLITGWPEGQATQQQVAGQLALSSRSLARHLAQEGTSFRLLLDESLQTRACQWLAEPGATVEQVAERLGYSDAANFTRAFRRWQGMSPRVYRAGRRWVG